MCSNTILDLDFWLPWGCDEFKSFQNISIKMTNSVNVVTSLQPCDFWAPYISILKVKLKWYQLEKWPYSNFWLDHEFRNYYFRVDPKEEFQTFSLPLVTRIYIFTIVIVFTYLLPKCMNIFISKTIYSITGAHIISTSKNNDIQHKEHSKYWHYNH